MKKIFLFLIALLVFSGFAGYAFADSNTYTTGGNCDSNNMCVPGGSGQSCISDSDCSGGGNTGGGGSGSGFGVSLQNPLCLSNGGSNCTRDFPTLLTNISTFITGLIATLSVIMFIWAGILFVTAGANPGNVEKAKKAALYAIIGIAVSLAGAGLLGVIKAVLNTGS